MIVSPFKGTILGNSHITISASRNRKNFLEGAQWLSGRVLDSRPKGRGFEPHRHHCVVSLSKNINPSLVLVQPRKTRPFITERVLMGRKESNQTNKQKVFWVPSCRPFTISEQYSFQILLCLMDISTFS